VFYTVCYTCNVLYSALCPLGECVYTYQANPDMLCYNKYISHSVLAHFSSDASDSIFSFDTKQPKHNQFIVVDIAQNILFAHLLLLYKH